MPNGFIVAFVVFDVVVTLLVLRFVIAKRGGLAAVVGLNLQQIMALSNEMEQEAETYLQSSWSGDPATLPIAMNALLDRFETRVREKGLPLTREQLKPMLGRIVLARRLAKSGEVHEALKQVA